MLFLQYFKFFVHGKIHKKCLNQEVFTVQTISFTI